jgi:hypothetical protein
VLSPDLRTIVFKREVTAVDQVKLGGLEGLTPAAKPAGTYSISDPSGSRNGMIGDGIICGP